jgi:hypothetical protein
MSLSDFYIYKAKQCDDLAAAATEPRERAKYQEQAAVWRDVLKDAAKQERDEDGLP